MDGLPPEILNKIFIRLNLNQRLICTLVCRSWWRILDDCSLFYRIELDVHKKTGFNRILDMFKRLPDRAAQVSELYLVLEKNTPFNRGILFYVFPNARVMNMMLRETWQHQNYKPYDKPIGLTHLNSRVESLSDFHHCDLVSQLLYSNLGIRLKTLYLDFTSEDDTPTKFDLSTLKDLPVLKKLTLRNAKIKIQDLEELHGNLPSIQDFALELMNVKSGTMSSIVTPAISITKFKLYRAFFKDTEAYTQFYKYVTIKYTNMIDIEFEDHRFTRRDTNDKSQLCVNGAFDFYRLTGLSKRELTIYGIPENIDPFEGLDAVGCRLKDLCILMCKGEAILRFLALSDQFQYIEQLTIKDTSYFSLQVIKNMPKLTKLSFGCNGVSLVDVLDACPPTLKSLYLDTFCLDDETPTNCLDSIEILHIDVLELLSDIGVIISSFFPNLVELRLSGEIVEDVTITLKNPHFREATFTTQRGFFDFNPGYGFSFLSPLQKETQYYFCTGDSKKTQVQPEEIQDLYTLSVICLTEKNVDLKSDSKKQHCHIWEIA